VPRASAPLRGLRPVRPLQLTSTRRRVRYAATDALKRSYGAVCATYDFEPFRSTNECKKGGWQTMRRADGSEFKNQGDCVSYVNTGK
jgi:hypothetical protein